ncbi:MAG TPA: carboxymuconolactone decarboxylase family protein, partial [Polyangiales bacterium]|nr:carboxymuconolactone decarboxylase family protein [Polyangiales bacterium]
LDIIKLVKYRADFYGKPMGAVTQTAMRGRSAWSVADRELMAAVVAKSNACTFCTAAHSSVARQALGDSGKVAAVLQDLETAPIEEPLRATLQMLKKLSAEHSVSAEDIQKLLTSGVSREQIEDALAVAFVFNTISRLAETFAFEIPTSAAMDAGAKFLLARGYG